MVDLSHTASTKAWYNERAEEWAKTHNSERYWEEEYGIFQRLIGPKKRILDAGCGMGRDVLHFMSQGYEVVGIDFSRSMLVQAKKRVPDALFLEMDLMSLTFPPSTFDAIWCCASLLHCKRLEAHTVLLQLQRVLKSGGILFVSVKEGEGERLEKEEDGSERFFCYYTHDQLRPLFETAGFEIVESHTTITGKQHNWLCLYARKGSNK